MKRAKSPDNPRFSVPPVGIEPTRRDIPATDFKSNAQTPVSDSVSGCCGEGHGAARAIQLPETAGVQPTSLGFSYPKQGDNFTQAGWARTGGELVGNLLSLILIDRAEKLRRLEAERQAVIVRYRRHAQKHPERVKARRALRGAVRRGKIKRGPCAVCGDPRTQGHHHDYSKPFEVTWLCRRHHEDVHHKPGAGGVL